VKPTATPKPPPTEPPLTYATITSRQWAKIVKDPDNYIGKGYKVWACIWQFDSRTGPDAFLATASYHKLRYWYSDGDDGSFESVGVDLSDIVQDDVVSMNVIVLGAYTYDTAAGGTNSVPSFLISKITRKGSC
jgi:hypothetical protein